MSNFRTLILSMLAASGLSAIAATPHSLSVENPRVAENFNSMFDASASDGSLILPSGWAIDRNLSAPRKVGEWNNASSEVMYAGGESLASNAKNGTWNFGASDDKTDRAIGGLTTTVSNGTRGVSLMTALTNDAELPIDRLNISYNIEKYRNGANAAGFAVQMYYSTDGVNWINAGDSFYNLFPADSETLGAPIVPISSTSVDNRNLLVDVAPGSTIYLAWNISVASGSTPDKAPGLALDDIVIDASFASEAASYIFIENALKAKYLSIYSSDNNLFGDAPGISSDLTKQLNGVTYNVWENKGTGEYSINVITESGNFGPAKVNASDDTYFCLSAEGLNIIAEPENYTGWVDPNRPPFVASGIYLRGEVNSWGAESDWEFSKEGDNTYVLYDKTLNGQFKIADAGWSASCNYGSNGSNIIVDSPYSLLAGTDSNISCGSYIFDCKRIILTLTDSSATLLLESNDDSSDLTSVYVYGDFNDWNYLSTTGELKLDNADGLFKGQISMKAGNDGLSHWIIYQRPGMAGAWGMDNDALTPSTSGVLTKGEKGTSVVAPGTYSFTFDINSGKYELEMVESAPAVMTLNPSSVILTPKNPETVKVLSLNNSLIHYNDQNFVFNDIAASENANASWTKHTNLGKPLSYHWNEGDGLAEDGTPGAKMMIRSDAWSHIILQEQSSLPRTNPETFRSSVAQWIEYIRAYCPNPNAVIILPVNWAYSSDLENFSDYNDTFLKVYTDVATELGAVVVPVAAAYDNVYLTDGSEELLTWFSDDRHPTLKATYMAACMEYGAIMNVDPENLIYVPAGMTAEEAKKMRKYASEALAGYSNAISHHNATIRFSTKLYDDFGIEMPLENITYAVDGGGSIDSTGLFISDGTLGEFTVTATNAAANASTRSSEFIKTAVVKVAEHKTEVVKYPAISLNSNNLEASEDFNSLGLDSEAKLPDAWRIDRQTIAPRTIGTYATAQSQTAYSGGINLASNAKNGIWNFGADGSEDRAPGGITTGVDNGTRAINLYTHIENDGKKNLASINVSYDIEKYRKGNNSAGFAVQLYYSYDGTNWVSAGQDFYTYFAPDSATQGYAEVPGETIAVNGTLPVALPAGIDLYLAWNISVASGSAAQGAMALAIDNVSFEAKLPEVPVTKYRIYVDNRTTWDSIGVYAWGDGEIFGAWPGQAPIDEQEIDGVNYTIFGLDAEGGNYNLIFNNWNNNKQLPDFNVTANRDYWFRIDDSDVKELIATGVEEITANNGSLYLTENNLYASDKTPITIFSTDGRQVAKGEGPTMNIASLPKGVYIAVTPNDSIKIAIR